MKAISSYISETSVLAARTSNRKVIDRIGEAVLRRVVESILKGGNLRDLTEEMTRKRILLNNAALVALYFRMLGETPNLEKMLTEKVGEELSLPKKLVPAHKKEVLLSLIGMTKKGWDNILRGETGKTTYLKKLNRSLTEIEQEVIADYENFEAELKIGSRKLKLTARSLLRCMMAIGSQTLTIRGSEKSTYGKLFERLVLGSVLTILGFKIIDKDDFSGTEMVFWLSDAKNKRECDATALITPGACIRFDIGFIGKGNTEISLDKVSRYDRFLELKSKGKHYKASSKTIIIVDTIGDNSKAWGQSLEIGGDILQMNGCYWVKELSQKIKKNYKKYSDPLADLTPEQTIAYIGKMMSEIDIDQFLPAPTGKKGKLK